MEFENFLEKLEFSEENYLVESGSPQKLRHYTNLQGLWGILKDGYIHPKPYYWGNKNDLSICVVRPSSHIINFNDKKYCGYFEIDFDILNDRVRNITKQPINELEIQYRTLLQKIAKKNEVEKEDFHSIQNLLLDNNYSAKEFREILKNKYKYNFSNEDCENFIEYYRKLIDSLYYKEGEERIYGNDIPINDKYIKFYEYDGLYDEINSLSLKGRDDIMYRIKKYKNIFMNYDRIKNAYLL